MDFVSERLSVTVVLAINCTVSPSTAEPRASVSVSNSLDSILATGPLASAVPGKSASARISARNPPRSFFILPPSSVDLFPSMQPPTILQRQHIMERLTLLL